MISGSISGSVSGSILGSISGFILGSISGTVSGSISGLILGMFFRTLVCVLEIAVRSRESCWSPGDRETIQLTIFAAFGIP